MDSFNNNDAFKQFVKGKLAMQQEVPPNGWEELRNLFLLHKKMKVVHARWLLTSVAAVAAALIGVFFCFKTLKKNYRYLQQKIKQKRSQPKPTKKGETLITKQIKLS